MNSNDFTVLSFPWYVNRDILDKIAEFEEQQFAGTKRDTDFQAVLKHVKLGPMNETGGTALLHMVT